MVLLPMCCHLPLDVTTAAAAAPSPASASAEAAAAAAAGGGRRATESARRDGLGLGACGAGLGVSFALRTSPGSQEAFEWGGPWELRHPQHGANGPHPSLNMRARVFLVPCQVARGARAGMAFLAPS